MGHIRNNEYPSTETFLAAKVNNKELKCKDILEAILSIGEYQLADRVCSDRGWLLSQLSSLEYQLQLLGIPISSRQFWLLYTHSSLFDEPSMVYLSLSCSDSQEKAKLSCRCVLTTAGWTLLNNLQTLMDSIQEVSKLHICLHLVLTLLTFARWL